MENAREKGAKKWTFNSQHQVFVHTVNGFRAHTITRKVGVDELLDENKLLIFRTNAENKPTSSSFNTKVGMKPPSATRLFQISSPIIYVDKIKHLESFRGDSFKLLDYVEGLLDKSPASKLLQQNGHWSDLQVLATTTLKFFDHLSNLSCQTSNMFAHNPRKCWNGKWSFNRFKVQYSMFKLSFRRRLGSTRNSDTQIWNIGNNRNLDDRKWPIRRKTHRWVPAHCPESS